MKGDLGMSIFSNSHDVLAVCYRHSTESMLSMLSLEHVLSEDIEKASSDIGK